jgi:hypothetical protein
LGKNPCEAGNEDGSSYLTAALHSSVRIEGLGNGYGLDIHLKLVKTLHNLAGRYLQAVGLVALDPVDITVPALSFSDGSGGNSLKKLGKEMKEEDVTEKVDDIAPIRRRRPKIIREEDFGKGESRRIEKNRETAARSNAKKKAMIDALKVNLAEMVQRETELRKKEVLLREENFILRRKVLG